jgi:hypothetical protein
MMDLIGKIVEIEAVTGWVIVPLDKIAFIREKKD